jgi:hypothetical protein
MDNIENGYCQCGCGGKTWIATTTNSNRGWIKGEPVNFIHNHHCKGENHSGWKGGRMKAHNGKYVHIKRGDSRQYEHILIAEKALGKPLPKGAVVHHYDGHSDESKNKLIICENQSYHGIIEARGKAYRACGHADWRKCKYCHKYDDQKNLYIYPDKNAAFHRSCNAEAQQKIRDRKTIARLQELISGGL